MKSKLRVPVVKQLTQTECGLCCTAMMLRYYKSKESLKELQEYTDVGRDGLSIIQIKKLFNERGFNARIGKVDRLEELPNIKKPFIAFWENKHFVVVEKIKKDKYYIKDPAQGGLILQREEFKKSFSKLIVSVEPTEEFKPQKHRKNNPWKDIFVNLFENKILIAIILGLLILTYLFTLEVPKVIQKVVDKALVNTNSSYLSQYALIFCGIAVLYLLAVLVRGLKFISLNVFLTKKLEMNTFKHLLKLPYKFFEIRSSGSLLFSLCSSSIVKEIIANSLINGIIDIGIMLVILGYMLSKSLMLALVVFGVSVINIVSMLIIQPKLKEATNEEIAEKAKAQTIQVESLMAIISVKIAAIEEEIYTNWKSSYENVIKTFVKRMKLSNINSAIISAIQLFGPVMVIFTGLIEFYKGNMTIGEIIAFQTIASMFFGLNSSIINLYTQSILATEYLERVGDIWYSEYEKEDIDAISKEIEGTIQLDNVSFSYSKNSPKVLKNISMNIKAGEKIALVGTSGSGKSTLSKLIVGLYQQSEGEILYDSVPMKKYNKKNLFRQIGIVEQDAMLFNKTIYENIVMNNKDATLEEVKKVCEITCIAKEIEEMPMKYNTIISEMGMNFSGGQRQRILLARALINDPKVLVLDEATSSLDNINEKMISDYLSRKGCTRLIVAHRLSTIIDADAIYVLSNGEIVETGKHEELMKRHGLYYRLYTSSGEVQEAVYSEEVG